MAERKIALHVPEELLERAQRSSGQGTETAGALIAQSFLDRSTPLITRDADFRHFAAAAGLPLL